MNLYSTLQNMHWHRRWLGYYLCIRFQKSDLLIVLHRQAQSVVQTMKVWEMRHHISHPNPITLTLIPFRYIAASQHRYSSTYSTLWTTFVGGNARDNWQGFVSIKPDGKVLGRAVYFSSIRVSLRQSSFVQTGLSVWYSQVEQTVFLSKFIGSPHFSQRLVRQGPVIGWMQHWSVWSCQTLLAVVDLCCCLLTVCLIYVERLMESAFVPIVGKTWRPCLLCGLLLASKVWQDLG